MPKKLSKSTVLSFLGAFGIVFYALAPVIFPGVSEIRQPELLPVYTLMLGLGQLLGGKNGKIDPPDKKDE